LSRTRRKELRRLQRLRKRDDAERRVVESPFYTAFRRLFAKGLRFVGGPEDCDPRDVTPAEFRQRVVASLRVVGLEPETRSAWLFLIRSFLEMGAPYSETVAIARLWIEANPDDPAAHEALVSLLIDIGQPERAAQAIREAYVSPAAPRLTGNMRQLCRNLGLDWMELAGIRKSKTAPPAIVAPPAPAPSLPREIKPPPPLPKPIIESAPVVFAVEPDGVLLERLLSGPHDDLDALDLGRRGAEVLAEERYDRLLSLPTVRGVKHLGYQIETVLRVLKKFHGRVLLSDEVGLGKTIEACLVLKEYLIRGQVRRALVLVPPALVGQWKAELEEKFGIPVRSTQDADFKRDPVAFWKGGPVLLASIALARNEVHRPHVLGERFDLVVVDEAHHLKNRSTKGWELVNGLRSRFFLMLTATPVETNLSELYNLVTLLRPGTLGTEAEFRKRFVRSDDPTQPKDAERLRELLHEVMVRNTRARCGVLLPPRTARTLIVPPTPEEAALYRLVVEETRGLGLAHRALFRTLLEESGSSPLAVARTAARVLREGGGDGIAPALSRIEEAARAVGTTTKLDRLAELIPGGKVLVFSRFRATTDQIGEDLARRGIPFVPFRGDMTSDAKDRAVEVFAQPGIDVLLCSEIGGEGRNLQFCHRLINFDLPWNPMKIEQRIGRIHRIGQTETVEVVNLACAGTAEERILEVLDRRVNLFELVVGEMDLLLGDLADEREFEDRVFDIYAASRADEEVDEKFQELADKLLSARGRLERTKALDAALFGEDYET